MLKRILVAVDGSDHARKAIELASDLAAKYGAGLVLLHVARHDRLPEELRRMAEAEHLAEPSPRARPHLAEFPWRRDTEAEAGAAGEAAGMWSVLGERILADAKAVAEKHGAKDVRTLIDDGDPVRQILDRVEREGVDLIVLGSRGLGDLKGLLLGSVSHKVAQLATCTCLTVK